MSRSTYLHITDFERLEEWCAKVRHIFHAQPYLVGSALAKPDYRDVDIRVMLDDTIFDTWFAREWRAPDRALGPGTPDPRRVRYMNRAMSTWGQHETGLPIDFQIQRTTEANVEFAGERNPMGTRNWDQIATSGVPLPTAAG